MTNALETRSICKTYRTDSTQVRAVDTVSIQVKAGEFVALVGPSGSGKTTMLAMLAGLLRPSQGEALVGGQKLSRMRESELTRFRLKNIGVTLQANNLVSFLTAQENVELMLRLNQMYDKRGEARAKELLACLGLADRLDSLPSQLSGGQQQRVAIARALVHEPSLVLADEPTASLDTERAYQVVETLASLIREQNRAGIMVTHDLRMCVHVDRVIQLVDGHLAGTISDQDQIEALARASIYTTQTHSAN
jgi:putative ABC transport system ATP-binding protein